MTKISGYRIVKTLGHGGMATVYLAVQKSVDRYVALKVMLPDLVHEKSFTKRFLAEARIAARFRHPNIIAIHDVNVEKGLPYIAMEYVPGGSLTSERLAKMSLTEKLSVVAQVADALGFLHRQNFVHRDVKPDNVIFRADGTAVLTDFGIARDEKSDLRMTQTGAVIGTPYFMSPEQTRGNKLDARSDLYSLGVMLYTMLVGEVPFDGDSALSIYIMHNREPVPDLPDEYAMLDPVVKRLMAKSPDDRYPDSSTFIRELAKVADTSPTKLLKRSFEGEALEITGETDDDAQERVTGELEIQSEAETAVISEETAELETSASPKEGAPAPTPGPKRPWYPIVERLELASARFQRWERVPTWLRSRPGLAGGAVAALVVVLLVSLVQVAGPDSVEDMLTRASEYAGSADPDRRNEAEALFREVLELDPSNEAALEGLEALQGSSPLMTERRRPGRVEGEIAEESPEPATAVAGTPDPGQAPIDGTAARVQELLGEGEQAIEEGRLSRPTGDSALAKFRAVLELDPGNAQAKAAIARIGEGLLKQIRDALDGADTDRAGLLLSDARSLGLADTQAYGTLSQRYIDAVRTTNDQSEELEALLTRARAALDADRLTRPVGDNAVAHFRSVLALDPTNEEALDGLGNVGRRYLELANAEVDRDNLRQARSHLQNAVEIAPHLPGITVVRERIRDTESRLAAEPEPVPAEPEPIVTTEPAPARAAAPTAHSIEVATLPRPDLSGSESASRLFELAEANLKTNNQLLAYSLYKEVLAREPDHRGARRRLYLGAQQYIRLASRDISNNDLASARKQLSLAIAIDPGHPELDAAQRAYRTSLENRATPAPTDTAQEGLLELRIKLLLSSADAARQRLKNDPGNRSALSEATRKYREVLDIDPGNRHASAAIDRLGEILLNAGQAAISREKPDEAAWYLEQARELIPDAPGIATLADALEDN